MAAIFPPNNQYSSYGSDPYGGGGGGGSSSSSSAGGGANHLQFYSAPPGAAGGSSSYMTGSGGGSGGGMGGRSSLEGNMSSRGAGPGGYSGSGGGPSGHGTAPTQAERNYMSSQMSFWSAFGTGGYPDEPSLMEELEVNLPHIWQKSTTVLNPLHRYSANHQRDAHMMDDTDLAGPLLFCFVFGALLFLVSDDCVWDASAIAGGPL